MMSEPTRRAWLRFRRNRPAYFCLIALAIGAGLAITAWPLSSRWFNVQDLSEAVRAGPSFQPVSSYEFYSAALDREGASSTILSIAKSCYPASAWFGYDELGRSMMMRCLLGWLVSLGIGLGAAGMSVTIGVFWGATAGLAGGRVDGWMMRVVDVLYGLPYVLFVILMKVVLEPPLVRWMGGRAELANMVILFLAIGAVSWLTMARVIRGQVLSLRSQAFVEAAHACGAGRLRILLRHLLPNLVGPITVYATLVIPQAILQESFLSFLGIGVRAPIPSLGRLAADGVQAINTFVGFWWLIVIPCGILVATLLALNFVGDGLRDAMDPKAGAVVTM